MQQAIGIWTSGFGVGRELVWCRCGSEQFVGQVVPLLPDGRRTMDSGLVNRCCPQRTPGNDQSQSPYLLEGDPFPDQASPSRGSGNIREKSHAKKLPQTMIHYPAVTSELTWRSALARQADSGISAIGTAGCRWPEVRVLPIVVTRVRLADAITAFLATIGPADTRRGSRGRVEQDAQGLRRGRRHRAAGPGLGRRVVHVRVGAGRRRRRSTFAWLDCARRSSAGADCDGSPTIR